MRGSRSACACTPRGCAHRTKLYNTELVLPADHDDTSRLLEALDGHTGGEYVPRDHDDFILAPDGKNPHFIDPTIDISDEIECGPRLEEALIEAEDDAGALKLVLETEDDVIKLEEFRYMISRPVCLCAESRRPVSSRACGCIPALRCMTALGNSPKMCCIIWNKSTD